MSNPFHLAVPAGDLNTATKFYVEILGCKLGNREDGKWVDVDFWGNELTLHKTEMKLPNERHDVDMGNVPVPHFGVHLDKKVFKKIKENLQSNNINYLDKPYIRFKGKKEEQETFFIKDPHGNILELKTLQNS
jgi:extradiol dioxygenase family protein